MAALIVYFFVIEGQGRTIEEIDTMYLEHVKPWKSTKWVPPNPEEMARIRRLAGTELAAEDGEIDDEGRHGVNSTDGLNGKKRDGSEGNGFLHRENVSGEGSRNS